LTQQQFLQQWRRSLQKKQAVNKVEDMEKKGFWSIRICPLEMVTAKGSSSNNVGFAKFAEDGKMPMSEVTALKSAIETMATEMD
jgi:hypothetical protein